MRTTDDIRNDILNYFKENEDEFVEVLLDLDSYNGYLGDDRWYDMEEFDELHSSSEPWEIARAAFYGDFRPCDAYWRYNAYGNLESTDYPEEDYASYYLDEYFVDAVIENANYLDLPVEVDDLLNELEELEYGA